MFKKTVVFLVFMSSISTLFSSWQDSIRVQDLTKAEIRISPGDKGISGADIKRRFVEKMDNLDRNHFSDYGPVLHDQHLGLFSIINAGKAVKDTDRITNANTNGLLTINEQQFTKKLKNTNKLVFTGLNNSSFSADIFTHSDDGVGMNTGVSLRRAVFKGLYRLNKDFFKHYGQELKDEDLPLLKIIRSGQALDVDFVGNIGVDRLHFVDNPLRKKIEELNKVAQEHQEYREAASSFMGRLAQGIKTVEEQVVDAARDVASELEELD